MFAGIVEAESRVLRAWGTPSLIRIEVEKPIKFNDLKNGDSVATNGVCLTVEAFSDSTIQFALGAETLHITGWSEVNLVGRIVNLERSLRLGDRIHGHLVAGHVDAMGTVVSLEDRGGSSDLVVDFPSSLQAFVWRKASWAINGVSLTVNRVEPGRAWQCLVPETLKVTNLKSLQPGDQVCLEVDWMARAVVDRERAALRKD